jgi:hypothetical protein
MALLTVLAWAAALLELLVRRARLRKLAREAGWDYRTRAEPELQGALLRHVPAPGAAAVRVIDILSGNGFPSRHIARVDYGLGAVRQRRDNTRIIAIQRGAAGETSYVAPLDLPRMEQYRHLLALLDSHPTGG